MASVRTRADRTLVDVAVRDLREDILRGKLQPGSSLVLVDLAERLSMSVMPIRVDLVKMELEDSKDRSRNE